MLGDPAGLTELAVGETDAEGKPVSGVIEGCSHLSVGTRLQGDG